MLVIPAIDLHGGRCVRLLRGERNKETVYSNKPEEVALEWQRQGATRLHVVDLDGAFEGRPQNSSAIEAITGAVSIPVQLGGGIRDFETVENALKLGVSRVILGTVAVENTAMVKEFVKNYGDKIIVGIDARQGLAATRGWVKDSTKDALELALQVQEYGVKEIIYTDIARDGTLEGPNFAALKEMAGALDIAVIASGGVSRLQDLHQLQELEDFGITGVIIGQALYAKKFSLSDAIREINRKSKG
ncbi:MAG: 1-(5-phosphoribosyl)-5-[(5-phosphoribosylamino)methylideneamino]imidazole-4-carboxamide isomerase [Dethiobacteria bacterium]|jgi:phosphoribosylformimino-5-aminoimidazole carboxamide ribotide isomerase